jgi:hypothetical protein
VSRDARRAYAAWQTEAAIFLLPSLATTERWGQKTPDGRSVARVAAIQAEHPDALNVLHVGANGYVFAPFDFPALAGRRINHLLTDWLNLDMRSVRILPAVPLEVLLPDVVDGRVSRDAHHIRFVVRRFRIEPGPAYPMEVLGKSADGVEVGFRWPPNESFPPTVHPDPESAAHIAPREQFDIAGLPGALDSQTGEWNPHLLFIWPAPFGRLLGPLAGFDAFAALASMRAVAAQSEVDPDGALATARTHAADYLSEGHSALFFTRFMPDALQVARPDEPLKPFWEKYGIKARTDAEALRSPKMDEPVPVLRVWGGIGLLWALLIDRLESKRPIRSCPRCGHFLKGRRKLCGKDENLVCFNERRAEDQRRSRSPD